VSWKLALVISRIFYLFFVFAARNEGPWAKVFFVMFCIKREIYSYKWGFLEYQGWVYENMNDLSPAIKSIMPCS